MIGDESVDEQITLLKNRCRQTDVLS